MSKRYRLFGLAKKPSNTFEELVFFDYMGGVLHQLVLNQGGPRSIFKSIGVGGKVPSNSLGSKAAIGIPIYYLLGKSMSYAPKSRDFYGCCRVCEHLSGSGRY